MTAATFKYYGLVKGQARPRFARGRAYKDKRAAQYEFAIANAYKEQCPGVFFHGPVSVEIMTYRALPKSRPKRVTSEPDTLKPDADNVAKAVLDALNGVAWADDAQVVRLHVIKQPRERCREGMTIRIEDC